MTSACRIADSATARNRHGPGALGRRSSVAVLPLANPSADWAVEHAAADFTELLIVNLSNMSWLRVASRTSSAHYKHARARLREIARVLKVSSVVEGSVLELGSQLQVAFSLIDTASDTPIVARTYTGQTATVLRMRSAIAWTMADEIASALRRASWSPLLARAS